MESKFFVIEQRLCPECQGAGLVQHPHWATIHYEWSEAHGDELKTMDQWEKFIEFSKQWYEQEYPGQELPDEEVKCRSCGGEGFIQMETQLVDALKALGIAGAWAFAVGRERSE